MKAFSTFLVLLCLSFSLHAQTSFNAQAEGERLERLWWDQQKNQDSSDGTIWLGVTYGLMKISIN